MTPGSKILVIAEGQLGDLVILTPALRALRETFPSSRLAVLVAQRRGYAATEPIFTESPSSGPSEVICNDPHVDLVVEVDRSALRALKGCSRIRAEAVVVSWLRRQQFDTVLCAFPQDRFFIWAFLSGAGVRIGEAGKGLSGLLTRRLVSKKSDNGVLRYYCALAEAAGARVSSYTTEVVVPEEAIRWAAEVWHTLGVRQPAVMVHPGASGEYKVWPPQCYAALIDQLQKERGISVVLCGSAFDREVIGEVLRNCTSQPHLVITEGGVFHLAAILRLCSLCVSNDSGPRHLAVAVGTPSLALIPRFEDREWKIYEDETTAGTLQSSLTCPACPAGECRNIVPPGERYGSYCLRALRVDDVMSRIVILLNQ